MKIWIVEDEALAARRLKKMVEQLMPEALVEKVLDSNEGLELALNQGAPDLIFSDIQLSDGLSLEVYRKLVPDCAIIFTTAFDQYAMEAFDYNSIQYLLKPIEEAKLSAAIQKFKSNKQLQAPSISALLAHFEKPKYKSTFLLKSGTRLFPTTVSEILCFKSSEKITEVHQSGGRKLIVNHSLEELESLLNPELFFRANRQFLLNRNHLGNIQMSFNGKLKLDIPGVAGEEIWISRDKAPQFKEWLEK